MPIGSFRTMILRLAALLLMAATIAAEAPAERAEARLVRIPVTLEEWEPGGCDGIVPAEIELREDGQPVEVTHFEPKRLHAAHAVVVDTGPEMLETLHATRKAVGAYLTSLPDAEPALLATFDERLVLHAALSTGRTRFRNSLEWIETGSGSRLWDSADRMIRYLASRPERKVLVLLTDGCESAGRSALTPREVAVAAARIESLVVFSVGIGLPARCSESGSNPVRDLELLAKRTGGELFLVEEAAELNSALAGIRIRIDNERYLTYKPLAFGQSPKDEPAKQDHRWRERKIRFAKRKDCGISVAGPKERYESLSRRYPPPDSSRAATSWTLNDTGDRLRGRLGGDGSLVSVLLPPFDRVVREDASLETPLVLAVENASNSSFLVAGDTLLDLRESLAFALAAREEYMAWARQRVKARRLEEIDALIAESGDAGAEMLSRARRALDEQEWEPEPLELQNFLAGWLGDVHGAHALRIVERRLATDVLDAFRARGAAGADEAISRAESSWLQVREWFPREPALPIVGLLVPAYDPVQQAIGYYRVLLPPPRSSRIHATFTGARAQQMIRSSGGDADSALHAHFRGLHDSEVALGPRLVRWLLAQPVVATELAGHFDVESVGYAHATPRDLLPLLEGKGLVERRDFEDGYPARQVTLVLEPRDDPERPLSVGAYFPREAGGLKRYQREPVCLVLPPEPRHTAAYRLLSALVQAERASPIPCLLQQSRFDAD